MNSTKDHRHRQGQLLAIAVGLCSNLAAGAECDGKYLAIDQHGKEYTVARPLAPLAETLRQAKAGVPLEQRRLAVNYEAGYLVSRCYEKAVYWYAKAAASGDDGAKQWLSKNKSVAQQASPECAEEGCSGSNGDENRVAVLYSNSSKSNHFYAPLSINGRTVQGLIDTGASNIAMSAEIAKSFGINHSGGKAGAASTANGKVATTIVTVPLIEVAGIKARNVPVSIGISGEEVLIGMSFLSRVSLSMGSGTLTMSKRK